MNNANLLLASAALLFIYVFALRKQPVITISKKNQEPVPTACSKMMRLDINGNEIPCSIVKKETTIN